VVPAGLLSSGIGFQSAEEHGLEACATLDEKLWRFWRKSRCDDWAGGWKIACRYCARRM